LAYWATIHPRANTPIAASNTDSGAEVPAPRAAALTPMISGMMNAALNTGPMKPTDCARTSIRLSFLPPSRSYPSPMSPLAIGGGGVIVSATTPPLSS
jgi:hypothetical protein